MVFVDSCISFSLSLVAFIMHYVLPSHQPSRLNVKKNDNESWDYTNPNPGCESIGLKTVYFAVFYCANRC